MSTPNTTVEEGKAHYVKVRAAFVGQGTTLNAWCKVNGLHIQNVREAFFGRWNGDKASALVARVTQAAGIK